MAAKRVSISLDAGLHERCKEYCGKTGRTFSRLVSIALEKEIGDKDER